MGQEQAANPNAGAETLDTLGDAFGEVEPNATTKPTPRDAAGRFQSQQNGQQQQAATVDEDPDEDEAEATAQGQQQVTDPDADEDEQEQEQQQQEELFEIKANGKIHKLTRAQYDEAASKGLAAGETWERASATQKQADAMLSNLNAQRAQVGQMLHTVQTHLRQLLTADQANLDTLAQTDPAAWVRAKQAFDARMTQLAQAQQAQQFLTQQQSVQEQQRQGQFLELQKESVLTAIPAWRDPDKAMQGVQRIHSLLSAAGFSEQEIGSVADARIVRVLHAAAINATKARKYDELKAQAGAANKRVANLPPANVVKPGTRQTPQTVQAEQRKKDTQRWKQNPNLDNLARLME